MPRSLSLTLEQVLRKLRDASKTAHRRGNVKPHEMGRINEALSLLANGYASAPMGVKAKSLYLDFLKNVKAQCGISMVVLCAYGFGKAATTILSERARLDLPYEIEKISGELDNEVLRKIAEDYPAGYVHQLTRPANAEQATSDQDAQGQPNLETTANDVIPQEDTPLLHSTTVLPSEYVSLQLDYSSLLKFAEQQFPGNHNLRMICPLSGVPLPYIEVKTGTPTDFRMKIELSLKSSEALIRHVLAATEPLH